ncbi:replication initiation protein [Rouxiella badensis]|uniref:replication initiation protein n=1 Tax=Rouxiella TaxID=1565532 RepID=UPI00126481BB|nr:MULTISPECIES: replication initiation protein [Rouxiella]KAB7893287.1 RepB family plasmid replication initiator protein [Rouxiella sp. S1S-2]MCC3705656.1 replication initiation protein [Rouxiella badensis]
MELEKLTVVQSNNLLDGAYGSTLDEIRLLYLALAQIDSRKPQPDTLYHLRPQDFQMAFGVNPTSSHRQLRDAADSLMKKPVTIYRNDPKTGKIRKIQMSWFSRLEYVVSDDHSAVVVRFGQDVAPYLYELKESFTQINFNSITKLESPFSLRLYSWLIKNKNINVRNNNKVIDVVLEITWMREMVALVGKYKDYRDFRQKLLEPAIDRINAHTDISVIWEPVKKGRTVFAIKFSYVDESTPVASKPLRPRLPRRPHAVAGSALEGEWARRSIEVFEEYLKTLTQYDETEKATLPDLRKLASWHKIVGNALRHKQVLAEIKARAKK